MLTAIVRSSLRHRGVVVALACMLIGYGVYSLEQAKYDVFPEFSPPQVVVTAEAPGLAPEQVELLVTQPIETAVNGVSGVQSIRSASIQGLSVITVLFNANTNVYLDRQVMTERLSTLAGSLPSGISPTVAPLTTSTSVVMAIGLTSPTQSPMQLRTVADWTVKLRLLAVPGDSKIAVFGGDEKQYQVQVNLQQLTQHDIGVDQVLAAAHEATGIRGAGFISTPNQRITLQSEGQATTPTGLANAVILQRQGANLTLGDVAHVTEGAAPRLGAASVKGSPAVILMVSAQYGTNTIDSHSWPGCRNQRTWCRVGEAEYPNRLRHLPPGTVHRHRSAQFANLADCRWDARHFGSVPIPVQLSHRRNLLHCHPSIAAGSHNRDPALWLHPQHHDAWRLSHRDWRSGGRCRD